MPTLNSTLSVILPAHDEESSIETQVVRCVSVVGKLFRDFDVLVVNDGSSDETGKLVEALSRSDSRIKLITHTVNRGYGAALRSGFAAATGQWIFFTDSDGQFDIEEMAAFTPLLEVADIVAGYRLRRMDNLYRRVMGYLYSFIMDLFFATGVKDINCAFKFIRAEILEEFSLESDGALINTEIIALARLKNRRIIQKGVNHYPRRYGKQSGGSAKVILKATQEFLRLYRRL